LVNREVESAFLAKKKVKNSSNRLAKLEEKSHPSKSEHGGEKKLMKKERCDVSLLAEGFGCSGLS